MSFFVLRGSIAETGLGMSYSINWRSSKSNRTERHQISKPDCCCLDSSLSCCRADHAVTRQVVKLIHLAQFFREKTESGILVNPFRPFPVNLAYVASRARCARKVRLECLTDRYNGPTSLMHSPGTLGRRTKFCPCSIKEIEKQCPI